MYDLIQNDQGLEKNIFLPVRIMESGRKNVCVCVCVCRKVSIKTCGLDVEAYDPIFKHSSYYNKTFFYSLSLFKPENHHQPIELYNPRPGRPLAHQYIEQCLIFLVLTASHLLIRTIWLGLLVFFFFCVSIMVLKQSYRPLVAPADVNQDEYLSQNHTRNLHYRSRTIILDLHFAHY